MQEIYRLDSITASKIAAGEVVERPVNIVKELLENALDAGATRINIDATGGGSDLIRVTDNGAGIRYEDLPVSVERFATSKARTVEDVYNISTFGFRGEALAAISAVSKFSVKSIREGDEAGEIAVDFGVIRPIVPAAISKGTQVSVYKLFENLPVRKKFLKSLRSNEGEMLKFVKQFSLVNHGLEIVLSFDDREMFRTYPSSSMLDVAKAVFSEDRLMHTQAGYPETTIDVCVSSPLIQRKRKDSIYIGVNGRVVKDTALTQAVIQAYHRLIPGDSYPMAAVDIRIAPSAVDVNIHPSKLEVRFESPSVLFEQLRNTVEQALKKFTSAIYADDVEDMNDSLIEEPRPTKASVTLEESVRRDPFARATPAFDLSKQFESVRTVHRAPSAENPELTVCSEKAAEAYKIIGQMSNMYILCENSKGDLLVIDQHVAHERVLYEKYRSKRTSIIPSMTLFEPVLVTLSSEDQQFLMSIADDMAGFGYSYELFGTNDIKIIRVPVDILKKDIAKEFKGLLNDALEYKRSKRQDITIVTMSCRNAVKAGDPLTHFEMQHLVQALFQTENPHTCPHGRPIVYMVNSADLAKKFHR